MTCGYPPLRCAQGPHLVSMGRPGEPGRPSSLADHRSPDLWPGTVHRLCVVSLAARTMSLAQRTPVHRGLTGTPGDRGRCLVADYKPGTVRTWPDTVVSAMCAVDQVQR